MQPNIFSFQSTTFQCLSHSIDSFLLTPPNEFSAHPGRDIVLECPGISNPVSRATWSRPDKSLDLNSNRITVHGYGLEIRNLHSEDAGTYICRLDNGETPVNVHTMRLNVLQLPQIIEAPRTSLTNESDRLELNCRAIGSPEPEIYWIINGENTRFDPMISTANQGTRLIISSVEKRHAGIVQCFARNEVGEANEGALVQVNPKQIDGGNPITLGVPHKSSRTKHSHRVTQDRRRNKGREYMRDRWWSISLTKSNS